MNEGVSLHFDTPSLLLFCLEKQTACLIEHGGDYPRQKGGV